MYALKDKTTVDIGAELAAVVAHVKAHWTPIAGLEQLVAEVQHQAFVRGRAWVDEYPIAARVSARALSRERKLEAALPTEEERLLGPHYDKPASVLSYMGFCTGALREAGLNLDGRWDYEKVVGSIYRAVLKDHPDLGSARPLGWEELSEGYDDFDGMAEYDPTGEEAAFNGANTATAGAGNFVQRTALPYVLYDEVCQGRKAASVLVGAIFSHFLGIVAHRNTQDLLAAIDELPLDALPSAVVFEFRLSPGNPLFQAIMVMAEQKLDQMGQEHLGQEAYAHALAAARAFSALPDAEKDAQRTKRQQDLTAYLESSLKQNPDDHKEKGEAASRNRGILLSLMPKPM